MQPPETFRWARLMAVAVLTVGLVGETAVARCYSPRVTSEHVADCSSLEAFRTYHRWKDLTGQDLALAVWRYLCDTETGVFHYAPVREGRDPFDWEFRIIRDPIKMLNVYGYGFCGAFGPTAAGIFKGIGFENARSVQIPAMSHNVTEVFYDGGWHYFDVDVRGVLFRRDGKTVASLADVVGDPTLWTRPARKLKPFFPADGSLKSYADGYRAKPFDRTHNWWMGGSTMDFVLRRGERFTRWWRPQGGRWSHQKEDAHNAWWQRLITKEPYGAKGNHPRFSIWTHGNGLFDYAPSLRKGSSDFDDGVFQRTNVEQTDGGLTPARPGPAEAVFEVNSPYVIVPLVGDLHDRSDDREASVVTFASRGEVRVSISLDFGRSYVPVKTVTSAGTTVLDLTPHLRERYQYLVKFTLAGTPGEAVLETLRILTWVQVAPASLPRLKQGTNRLRFATGDKHGLATTPWMQTPNFADRDEMSRYWVAPPEHYDPNHRVRRLTGEMDLLFTAPPGRTIKWMSLGGFFHTGQKQAAARTANEIWYAPGDTGRWTLVHRSKVPTWHAHWHYAADEDVVLQKPVDRVRVRYVGKPGVNGVRVNLHSLKPEEQAASGVVVTHAFTMNGTRHEKRFAFEKPTDYTIDCPAVPEDVFIRLEAPGDGPRS